MLSKLAPARPAAERRVRRVPRLELVRRVREQRRPEPQTLRARLVRVPRRVRAQVSAEREARARAGGGVGARERVRARIEERGRRGPRREGVGRIGLGVREGAEALAAARGEAGAGLAVRREEGPEAFELELELVQRRADGLQRCRNGGGGGLPMGS